MSLNPMDPQAGMSYLLGAGGYGRRNRRIRQGVIPRESQPALVVQDRIAQAIANNGGVGVSPLVDVSPLPVPTANTPTAQSIARALEAPVAKAQTAGTPSNSPYTVPRPTPSTDKTALMSAITQKGTGGSSSNKWNDIAMILAQGAQAAAGPYQNLFGAKLGASVEKDIQQEAYQGAMAKMLAGESLGKEDYKNLTPAMVESIAATKKSSDTAKLGKSEAVMRLIKSVNDMFPASDPTTAQYRLPMIKSIMEQADLSIDSIPGIDKALGAEDIRQKEEAVKLGMMDKIFGQDIMKQLVGKDPEAGVSLLEQRKGISPDMASTLRELFKSSEEANRQKENIFLAAKLAESARTTDTTPEQQAAMLQGILKSLGVDTSGMFQKPTNEDQGVSALIQSLAK